MVKEALIGVAMTVGLTLVASLVVALPLVARTLATRGEVAGAVRGCPDDDGLGCECEDCEELPW